MNSPQSEQLISKEKKIIKTVSGTTFWEGGFETGECEGMPSAPPRWFCDIRNAGRLRINCLTQATLYLRSDGFLFHITPLAPMMPKPLVDALGDEESCFSFIRGAFTREEVKLPKADPAVWRAIESKEGWMYETAEYVPSDSCDERLNIWKVAAGARRTGRFPYSVKRKTSKSYLEGASSETPWIFAPSFDQFTEDYEKRYRQKVDRIARERAESKSNSRKNARTFRFEFNFRDFVKPENQINHYEVLGIDPTSGPREIKKAYWNLARLYHPDLNPGNADAEDKFKCISMSYQVLISKF